MESGCGLAKPLFAVFDKLMSGIDELSSRTQPFQSVKKLDLWAAFRLSYTFG